MALLQVAQQIDDLGLDGDVERRGRFVEHDEFGLEHHGAGDGDALALAAGEFVRIAEAGFGRRGRLRRSAWTTRASRSAAVSLRHVDGKAFADDVDRPRGAG